MIGQVKEYTHRFRNVLVAVVAASAVLAGTTAPVFASSTPNSNKVNVIATTNPSLYSDTVHYRKLQMVGSRTTFDYAAGVYIGWSNQVDPITGQRSSRVDTIQIGAPTAAFPFSGAYHTQISNGAVSEVPFIVGGTPAYAISVTVKTNAGAVLWTATASPGPAGTYLWHGSNFVGPVGAGFTPTSQVSPLRITYSMRISEGLGAVNAYDTDQTESLW